MSATKIELLEADLVRDEGEVLHAYTDSLGYVTIGVGHLIDKRKGGGIPLAVSRLLLDMDITAVVEDLRTFPWWEPLDPVRKRAMANFRFQLGAVGLRKFRATLAAIASGDYVLAAEQMAKSLWARQTPKRAQRVIRMMATGEVE